MWLYNEATGAPWLYKMKLYVTEPGSWTASRWIGNVLMSHKTGKMEDDFSDIRFIDIDGTQLKANRVTYTSATDAIFDIEFEADWFDDDIGYIWVYYGMSGVSVVNDLDDIYEFYDEFSELDPFVWMHQNVAVSGGEATVWGETGPQTNFIKSVATYGPGTRIEWIAKYDMPYNANFPGQEVPSPAQRLAWGGIRGSAPGSMGVRIMLYESTWICESQGPVDKTQSDEGPGAFSPTYTNFAIEWLTGKIKFYMEGILVETITTNITEDNQPITFGNYQWGLVKDEKYYNYCPYFYVANIPANPDWQPVFVSWGENDDGMGGQEESAPRPFRVAYYITDKDGAAITSGQSPIAFRDADQSQFWIVGVHVGDGIWAFELPSGWSSGYEIGVNTSGTTYSRDTNLSGGTLSGSGFHLSPIEQVKD